MSKEDLELEELERQFLEDLNSKPKPKPTFFAQTKRHLMKFYFV